MKLRYCYLALVLTFILGFKDGFIALWKIPDPEPIYISDYSTASLPPADRMRLENGLRVETKEELARLLEDYLS